MTLANDLMSGVAELLAAAGVGTWTPTGAYGPAVDRPIFIRDMPANPDRLIVVSHYLIPQRGWTTDVVEGIQVRNRGPKGDSRPADDDADAIRAVLDGREHVTVGGRHVSLIEWRSGAPMGRDDNRRWETAQNFYLFTTRPSAHRDY